MNKKVKKLGFLLILFFVIIIIFCFFYMFDFDSIDINDFRYELKYFKIDEDISLTPQSNVLIVKKYAYNFLKSKYPDSIDGRVLCTFYDKEQEIWLVQAKLIRSFIFSVKGGDLFVAIDNKSGNVIAYWSEK